jgi:uncharacterized membrane protein YtjA (UPF0391 family)
LDAVSDFGSAQPSARGGITRIFPPVAAGVKQTLDAWPSPRETPAESSPWKLQSSRSAHDQMPSALRSLGNNPNLYKEDHVMLRWALIFAIISIVAALLGFTGVAGAAAGIAKFLFFLFVVLFVIFLIMGATVVKKVT